MQRIVILAVVVLAVGAFFALGLGHYLSLEYLQASRERAIEQAHQAPVIASFVFFAVYVLVTGLSLPGAAVMTLAAGAIFGLVWGVLLVSFASSVGATLAFLIARSLLGAWVTRRFGAIPRTDQPGLRQRRQLLSIQSADGAGLSVLRRQPVDGSDAHRCRAVLRGQPDRHARGNRRLCLRRHATGGNPQARRRAESGADDRIDVARRFSARRKAADSRSSRSGALE